VRQAIDPGSRWFVSVGRRASSPAARFTPQRRLPSGTLVQPGCAHDSACAKPSISARDGSSPSGVAHHRQPHDSLLRAVNDSPARACPDEEPVAHAQVHTPPRPHRHRTPHLSTPHLPESQRFAERQRSGVHGRRGARIFAAAEGKGPCVLDNGCSGTPTRARWPRRAPRTSFLGLMLTKGDLEPCTPGGAAHSTSSSARVHVEAALAQRITRCSATSWLVQLESP
jgi:hypothetical protein